MSIPCYGEQFRHVYRVEQLRAKATQSFEYTTGNDLRLTTFDILTVEGRKILTAISSTTVSPSTSTSFVPPSFTSQAVSKLEANGLEKVVVRNTTIDLPGPLYGFRAWEVTNGNELRGLVNPALWEGPVAHTKDVEYGEHGFYALAHYNSLETVRPGSGVYGIIEMFGTVDVHYEGFRASSAQIVYLFNNRRYDMKGLEERYRCPSVGVTKLDPDTYYLIHSIPDDELRDKIRRRLRYQHEWVDKYGIVHRTSEMSDMHLLACIKYRHTTKTIPIIEELEWRGIPTDVTRPILEQPRELKSTIITDL